MEFEDTKDATTRLLVEVLHLHGHLTCAANTAPIDAVLASLFSSKLDRLCLAATARQRLLIDQAMRMLTNPRGESTVRICIAARHDAGFMACNLIIGSGFMSFDTYDSRGEGDSIETIFESEATVDTLDGAPLMACFQSFAFFVGEYVSEHAENAPPRLYLARRGDL